MIARPAFVAAISFAGWSSQPVLFILVMLYSITGPLGVAGTSTQLSRLVHHMGLRLVVLAYVQVGG
ncbi:hypothetical protein ATY30_14250 [Sinorhizobium americanum]|uniref:Uncharacterized protein n=1 Tax=Sinorhizobium americanum TaxID=194963 RepID=A0A2S3YN88_9HYPH|nr:hypothetical protein ATY30_14250 [Sinorhizobium americanum]POH30545.1 hypothetical protein ATY31_14860 [Sinorhizobium americanum]